MVSRILPLTLGLIGLVLAATPASSAEGDNALSDELAVKSAGLPVDAPGLLEFLRTRTKGDGDPARLNALLEKLESKSAADREKACAAFVAIGPPSIPYLRKAEKDPDSFETAGLARQCLQALVSDSSSVTASVVRLIAIRKPEDAVQALLDYIPSAEDESVMDEVKNALAGMSYTAGKPDPSLLKALEDEAPLRRAAAIDALCSNGSAEPRATFRKLLADPTPTVRLRAALALASARDAKAVSTLIALLGELPPTQGRYAEEFLVNLAADQAPKLPLTDEESRSKVKDQWAAWWLEKENAEVLIAEFNKRTLAEDAREKAEQLIKKLGDDDYPTRQEAKEQIKKLGVIVVPMLKLAVDNTDLEVSQSAKLLLQEIEKDKTPLSSVYPRLIALRKPKGGVEALLAYLPFCDDEGLTAEIQTALNAVAYDGDNPNPALLKARGDTAAARRGAAAEALCFGDLGDNLAAVTKLLKDESPDVRLQAALALAGARHADAVDVVINSIGTMPGEASGHAEEYMLRVAAERPPLNLPVGDDARTKRQQMWADWWKENGKKVALVDRYPSAGVQRYFGYTLLVQTGGNAIVELGPDLKERWKMDGLANPQDVQPLPSNRFLVTEYQGQRVTERDPKGNVKWTKSVVNNFPTQAQRLANGNTFIVCRNQLMEVDRSGKDVYPVINRPNSDILTAQKMRNGEIVMISSLGTVIRLDTAGKELKNYRLPQQTWTVGNEILPNGNALVVLTQMNKVVEFDPEGKQVWESAQIVQPMAASRSPNGNTWIVSQQWPNKMVEVDRSNKQVNELQLPVYTMRVRRR
jgi:HEAT repeat protein